MLKEVNNYETKEYNTKRSYAWDRDKIKKVLTELNKQTEPGHVRVIPLSSIQEHLRIDNKKEIAHLGKHSREIFLEISKEIGLNVGVTLINARGLNNKGAIEVHFKGDKNGFTN